MKIIRASEIGTYLFCQRAWWYMLQGYESENISELASGSLIHEKHGAAVFTSGCLRWLAYGLLLLALLVATVWAMNQLL